MARQLAFRQYQRRFGRRLNRAARAARQFGNGRRRRADSPIFTLQKRHIQRPTINNLYVRVASTNGKPVDDHRKQMILRMHLHEYAG